MQLHQQQGHHVIEVCDHAEHVIVGLATVILKKEKKNKRKLGLLQKIETAQTIIGTRTNQH